MGFFADVQTNANGVTSVLIRYADGTVTDNHVDHIHTSIEADQGVFSIKSRTVDARGKEIARRAFSWTLVTDYTLFHRIAYVGQDRNGIHALVTENTNNAHPFQSPSADPTPTDALLFTMHPGEHARGLRVSPIADDPIMGMARSNDGSYFLYGQTTVRKLNRNFRPDRTFGVRGVGLAETGFKDSVFADEGRFLAIDDSARTYDSVLERYA